MTTIHEHLLSKKAPGAERRITKRVSLSFQIEVSGRDVTGAAFCERATTTDVSQNGCRFDFLRELKPGHLLSISVVLNGARPASTEPPTIFQVVWVEPSELGWTVGAMALQNKNLWHMAFPAKK